MKTNKFGVEDIKQYVGASLSFAGLLKNLNVAAKGANYRRIKFLIKENNIDSSHFKGMGWRKNRTFPLERLTIDKILVDNSVYKSGNTRSSCSIKNILFNSKLKEKICEKCGLSSWLDNEIPLELHHIDGNSANNLITNLQIVCPNCHALTENYRGKNISNRKEKTLKKENNIKEKKQKQSKHNTLTVEQITFIRETVLNSNIDFTKFGWVAKLAPLIGRKHQKVNYLMKKYCNEFYNDICFKRR